MKCCKLALFALLGFFLVGCAARQNATTTASTEWRIKSLEENFLNFREKQRELEDQHAQAMERIDKRLEAIETELAALRSGGAMPSDAPANESAPMDEQGWVTDLQPDEDGWVEGQKPMAQSNEEKPWANVPQPPAVIPEPAMADKTESRPQATPKSASGMASAKSPKAMYDMALAKYNADDFEGARGGFDEFLARYPKDELAPNALYWKGETYYSQKDYAQAILVFKEVTGRFPKHHKSASALLKIGMSYDRVGDPDNAVFYLRALVEDFPKSDAARLARKELKRLGG